MGPPIKSWFSPALNILNILMELAFTCDTVVGGSGCSFTLNKSIPVIYLIKIFRVFFREIPYGFKWQNIRFLNFEHFFPYFFHFLPHFLQSIVLLCTYRNTSSFSCLDWYGFLKKNIYFKKIPIIKFQNLPVILWWKQFWKSNNPKSTQKSE